MRSVAVGEALLLLAVLGLAYLAWLQQEQLAELALEVDKIRGATGELASSFSAFSVANGKASATPRRRAPKAGGKS